MCGIFAIRSREKHRIATERIDAALQAMQSRGPDESNIWLSGDERTGLGHARLSLIGLKNGAQPVANEDGTIHLTANGEFYNFAAIRKELELAGHRFRTESDCEIAVHLYEEHGLSFLSRLRGEFAFVLYDQNRDRIIAARDRFGVKPLLHCEGTETDEWLFASVAKSLFAAGVSARWSREGMHHSLSHQYLPPDQTLFHGIYQVPPAHFAIVEKGSSLRIERYWEPRFHEEDCDPDQESDEVLELLRESVALRLQADVPVAFALSAGIDSSSIVALASQMSGDDLPAFSVSFDHTEYDELSSVAKNADLLGANVHPVRVRRQDLIEKLPEAVAASEGLAINGQLVGKFMLSRAVQEAGFKAILTGEGADEAFLGYEHLRRDAMGVNDSVNPTRGAARQVGVMLPAEGEDYEFPDIPDWLGKVPTFLKAKLPFASQYKSLLHETEADRIDQIELLRAALANIREGGGSTAGSPFPVKSAWLWTKMALSQYILRTLGDGTEMAHSVEGRPPFLDHVLFERAVKIPVHRNCGAAGSKMVLRKALRAVLPDTIANTPKHPFLSPPLLLDSGPAVRDAVFDSLRCTELHDSPFFNYSKTLKWAEAVASRPAQDLGKLDPILTTILSSLALQKAYQLASP